MTFSFWENMWSDIRSWFGGRQYSGTQNTGPDNYAITAASTVTEESALQVSSVWACVGLLSKTVASLPVVVYRKTPNGRVIDSDHWFARFLDGKPNQYQTWFEFWEHQIGNLVLHGNMYCKRGELLGQVRSLLPLNPLQVETRLIDSKVAHLFAMDGNISAFAAESIWHARMNGDLIVGRSPLRFARNIIGVAQSAETAVTNIYMNGGKPSGVLSFDRLLTAQQRESIRSSFSTLTTGTSERLLVLEQGATFSPISMTPEDIELLQSRRFQMEEICRWFGVPSVLVNDTNGSTVWGSGIEQIVLGFYKFTIRAILEAVENSIKTHLLTADDRKNYEVEFDFEALLRADMKARFEAYRVGISGGFLKPNEARRMEWLPDAEGGDSLYMQGAMVNIEDATKLGGGTNGTP